MKKSLIFGIILLFIGMSFSSMGINVEKSSNNSIYKFILYVGGDGPGNYTKIQDAIDDSSNGDTLFVYNGTYFENLNVDKSIYLIGENRNITVINGGKADSVVEVNADNVCIEEFTITNGIQDFAEAGINVFSNRTTIRNNIIMENQCNGIRLYNSFSSLIENNFFKNNIYYHIDLNKKSNNNTIRENFLTVSQDWHKACDGIALSKSSNNLVKNNEIIGMNYGVGITIFSSSNFNVISENLIHNNPCSSESNTIQIYDSDYNLITNNSLKNNSGNGIVMFLSIGNEVNGNTITFIQNFGISLSDCRDNNIIKDNNIFYTKTGIELSIYSSKNIIESNNLSNNEYGISMRGTDLLNYVPNNIIIKNNLIENDYGIYITTSKYGPSNNNLIYFNNFINNTKSAIDKCSNMWNNSNFGNYWDNYSGVDTNLDEIGDSDHSIPNNGNKDMYPLMESFATTELKINLRTGIFRVFSADIINIGDRPAFNVQWNRKINGGIIFEERNKSGPPIEIVHKSTHPEPKETIKDRLSWGLGKIEIIFEVTAENAKTVTRSIQIYLLLFLLRSI